MIRITKADWAVIERWIVEELLDEDERADYLKSREIMRKLKGEKKMDELNTIPQELPEPGRSRKPKKRAKQMAFDCGDELSEKVRAYCGSNHIPIGEFCRQAIVAALEAGQTDRTEPEQSEESSVVAPATPTRGLILDIARQIVCADRNDTYGSAEDNFGIIAELWKPYLKGRGIAADNLTSIDVAILMIQLKVARVATGKFKLDNFVDICGYAACGGECGGRHD